MEDFGVFVLYAVFFSAQNKHTLAVQPQGGYVNIVVGSLG
jgi:hypothetical protein